MSVTPKTELLRISPRGVVQLPEWAWRRLLKMSRVRSKKKRIQRKVIKREFIRAVYRLLEKNEEQ